MKNRAADITLSILFVILAVIVSIGLGVISVMLAMMTDSCGANSCNMTTVDIGFAVAVWGNPLVTLVFIALTIVASARHRSAWYLPLLGMLLAGVSVVAGALVIAFSVQGFFGP